MTTPSFSIRADSHPGVCCHSYRSALLYRGVVATSRNEGEGLNKLALEYVSNSGPPKWEVATVAFAYHASSLTEGMVTIKSARALPRSVLVLS
jgi:hypothetical protein